MLACHADLTSLLNRMMRRWYDRTVDINIETAMDLGRAALGRGDTDTAEAHFRDALGAGCTDSELYHHLGYIARQRDDLDAAAAHYGMALEQKPRDIQILNNLGETRRAQGFKAEAIALYRRARALAPEEPMIAANLGSVLLSVGRPDLALPHLEYAASLDRNHLQCRFDIAICLCSSNRYHESLAVYREIYEIEPARNEARYLEALAHLALGDLELGYRKHEVRWYSRLGEPLRRIAPGPYWLGEEDLTGQTILVHAEQGLGDTIMLMRYIPMLRERGATVVIETHAPLKPLLEPTEIVFCRGEDSPPYQYHISFMSLPRAFRTVDATIPNKVPYLKAPKKYLAKWRKKLGKANGKRRIAVAWTGASDVWNRAIPLACLEPLFALEDCEFHVVQTKMERGDLELLAEWTHVVNHADELVDFGDSAAIVQLMDMVITVDTALAHLGGALAKPTWTMLPFGAEYRWRTHGETTKWYPTMRLFRQPELFAWPEVVERIIGELKA